MKRVFLALVLVAFVSGVGFAAEKKTHPIQKFKTTITIVYNELTLEEAAKKEKEIKARYDDACSVEVILNDIGNSSGYLTFSDVSWITSNQ